MEGARVGQNTTLGPSAFGASLIRNPLREIPNQDDAIKGSFCFDKNKTEPLIGTFRQTVYYCGETAVLLGPILRKLRGKIPVENNDFVRHLVEDKAKPAHCAFGTMEKG
jgi:hypothetical protein